MKNTKPMRHIDQQRWQPPAPPANAARQGQNAVGERLPWLVGVSREPGRLPAGIILPARLFLAITYLYAGLQKFTDPQFFNAAAPCGLSSLRPFTGWKACATLLNAHTIPRGRDQ